MKFKTVGEIVIADSRTAEIFKSYQIDFCCNGHRSLEEACLEQKIDIGIINNAIKDLDKEPINKQSGLIDFQHWPLDLLADYIEKKHHRFTKDQIPAISAYLKKILQVHGTNHPELIEINALFQSSSNELVKHMKSEESILFPYVRNMVTKECTENHKLPFSSIRSPINVMMKEHDMEGEKFRKIRVLANNYLLPKDVCSTYKLTYDLLNAFEEDLHFHIHLENNILFPQAIEMEKNFGQ